MQVFDPKQEVRVTARQLPHWSQAGTVTFITWRTWDSLPEEVVLPWRKERAAWLAKHGVDLEEKGVAKLREIDPNLLEEYRERFSDRWENLLDECRGECVLRRPELALVVADSLLHFHGSRYLLSDFVVMPNHVHVLVAFADEGALLAQCESWKHYTARLINRKLGRSGRFWQSDAFDHLVRTEEQFEGLRSYVAENPAKAKLRVGEFLSWSSRSAVMTPEIAQNVEGQGARERGHHARP